jgi:hypothetical protein
MTLMPKSNLKTVKVHNVAKLKHFYKNVKKSVEKEGDAYQFNKNFNQPNEKALTD